MHGRAVTDKERERELLCNRDVHAALLLVMSVIDQ